MVVADMSAAMVVEAAVMNAVAVVEVADMNAATVAAMAAATIMVVVEAEIKGIRLRVRRTVKRKSSCARRLCVTHKQKGCETSQPFLCGTV